MQLKHNNTMASHFQCFLVIVMVTLATFLMIPSQAVLTPGFYDKVCPQALSSINSAVKRAIARERRNGASLLRLHFHDCVVNGCDGSVLLDDTPYFRGEKTAHPNVDSLIGFDVVDEIKAAVDKACNGPVVSCADILAIAARDSIRILGGEKHWYQVLLGRRDARTASLDDANKDLPVGNSSLSELLTKKFQPLGFDLKDLVVLSGGHTIGFAQCDAFKGRLYNDTNIDPKFAATLKKSCPPRGAGGDHLSPFDATPGKVDNTYYTGLLRNRGLLHTDQELFKGDGSESDKLVQHYSSDPDAFAKEFGAAMIKMGNIKPLTGKKGEIRFNCRRVN